MSKVVGPVRLRIAAVVSVCPIQSTSACDSAVEIGPAQKCHAFRFSASVGSAIPIESVGWEPGDDSIALFSLQAREVFLMISLSMRERDMSSIPVGSRIESGNDYQWAG
ncbi:hypothetical protein JMJ77_0009118 [Colletotrichum scovillei]|uniref:Uncharacterized protein n=1 Tax=Colletotrichum scovillei TaxID=1209932 RepID=A0A9P7QYP0_9PEZI|nr:hypothetical protein JMJ77_0009118 [Colletotrichum scovillei]KAG7052193.1 hypothetical protein JMJ78_0005215 [Colletotrichum scovillei]KAG7064482.1 hypothetical protein JMJ76_0012247 [Colletotrichum scovillei]